MFGSFPPPLINSTTQEINKTRMITATLKGHYVNEYDNGVAGTITVDGRYLKLSAATEDFNFHYDHSLKDISMNHISLSLKKPLSCMLHYTFPFKELRFKFMNTILVNDKPLSYTYTHWINYRCGNGYWKRGYMPSQTMVDASLVIDSANKVLVNYGFDTGNCTLTYNHVHKELTTMEPSYDFGKNSWALAVSRRVNGNNSVRASYQRWDKILRLEWFRNLSCNWSSKISASLHLAENRKLPMYSVESTLSFM